MSSKLDDVREKNTNVDLEKRKFMGKFGKYAMVGAGMATLMTPTASSAFNSGVRIKGNNGWGNGDQAAPGGSLFHNQAENTVPAGTPANNGKHGVSNPQ